MHGRSRIVAVCALAFLTGCMAINKGLMGMGNLKKNASVEEQADFANKNDIPQGKLFVLDTTYRTVLDTILGGSYDLRKALWQPLQVRVYDRGGKLVHIVANCHVGGFPNLDWERTKVFDPIPPPRSRMIDSTITMANDLRYVRTVKGLAPPALPGGKDHTFVVYWTVSMGRQSKRLIKLAQERQAHHVEAYDVYFVAADNLYDASVTK